jgi:peptide/nickel transport system substrate-binding protein
VTDVPTKDLEKYTSLPRVAVVTAANPRRIWTLAINHQTLSLQNVDVRRGLLHAIDREVILNEVFRAGKKEFHKALTGPYPAGAWCAPVARGTNLPLFNQDLATGKLRSLPDVPRPLTLLYPADDKPAGEACQKIKTQIEACGKLTLNLEPVPSAELWTRVQQETRYDLAYVPFDYPDIWFAHALAAALDPTAAGRGGRNYWNYLVKATNPSRFDDAVGQALAAVKQHRDTTGQLGPLSQELAVRFTEAVPFIPLWQLDRHVACSTNLKVYFDQEPTPGSPKWLDPVKVFQNVGRWRMDDGR